MRSGSISTMRSTSRNGARCGRMARIWLMSRMAMELAIIAAVDPILSYIQSRQPAIVALIRQFVECESPSDSPEAVNRFVELLSDTVSPFAKVKTLPGGKYGKQFVAEISLPGRRKAGQLLALGHSDTVWPLGTLKSMPFREADGRLWGPGVLDMKAGIAFFIHACRTLRDLDIPANSKVFLQINPDEEVGSEVS